MTVAQIFTNIINFVKTGVPNNVKSSNMRALLTWITRRMDIRETGRLSVYKYSGNVSIDQEIGDRCTGVIEDTFVRDAIYIGGNISLLSSYVIPGSSTGDNSYSETYEDIAEMLADQADQELRKYYLVLDASDDPDINSGKAVYLFLGTETPDLQTDYIRLSDGEIEELENSQAYQIKTIFAIEESFSDYSELANGQVWVEYNGSNVTHIIFDLAYTQILDKARELFGDDNFYFNIYNSTKNTNIRGVWASLNTVDAGSKLRVQVSGVTLAEIKEGDVLHLGLPINLGEGSIDLNPYQLKSEKGAADGYASLDGSGKVPSGQLPSYVDDVLEFANLAAFPPVGETGKIYVALDTNFSYRWTGSVYVKMIDLTAAEAKTLYESNANTNAFTDDEKTKLTNLRPRTPIVATGVSGTYNIDFALSIEWKITCTGATTITFSNYDEALGETTGVYITGAVPVLPATVNVVPGSEDFDASLRNYMVLNVFDATASSEIVDMQNKLMTV